MTRGACSFVLTVETGSEEIRDRFRGPASFTNDALLAFVADMDREGVEVLAMLSRNLPLDRAGTVVHRAATRDLVRRLRRFRRVTPVHYNLQLDPGSGMYTDPDRFHCRPLWRSLRDYHEANRGPDAGPGFVTDDFPEDRWNGLRTAQFDRLDLRLLNLGFRLGGRVERGARSLVGATAGVVPRSRAQPPWRSTAS